MSEILIRRNDAIRKLSNFRNEPTIVFHNTETDEMTASQNQGLYMALVLAGNPVNSRNPVKGAGCQAWIVSAEKGKSIRQHSLRSDLE